MTASRTLGPYELVAPLAEGGMAEIFVARRAGIGGFEKQVALKVIHPNFSSDPAFVRMLVEEAKISVLLQHANIVQTYDLGCVDEEYYIAMELIDGVDLFRLLRKASDRNLEFPFEIAAFIAHEVSLGLDYAHRRSDDRGRPLGIIHRDVSPQNVLLSRDGEIKIVDFGIAKAALREHQTEAGVIKGKYYYMSPEQALGEPLDPRTDVFSTGILLYEMLVGQMLYLDDDIERLLDKVRKARIPPPSGRRPKIPISLERIVMKALRRRREERFASSGELAAALHQYMKTAAPTFGREQLAHFVANVLGENKTNPAVAKPSSRDELPPDEHSLLHSLPVKEPADFDELPTPAPVGAPPSKAAKASGSTQETTSPEKKSKLRAEAQFGVTRDPNPSLRSSAPRVAPRTANEETRPSGHEAPPARPAPAARSGRTANEETRPAALPVAAPPSSSAPPLDFDDEHTIVDSGGETLIGERPVGEDDAPSPVHDRQNAAPSVELRLPTAGATPLSRPTGEDERDTPRSQGTVGDEGGGEGEGEDSTSVDRLARPKQGRARSAREDTNPVDLAYRSTASAPILTRPSTPLTQSPDEVTNESRPPVEYEPPSAYSDPEETRPMADGAAFYAAPQKNYPPPPSSPMPLPALGSAYGPAAEPLPTGSGSIDLTGRKGSFAWLLGGIALLSALVVAMILVMHNQAPSTGSVQIVSAPPGAEVRLDGVSAADRTPLQLHQVDTSRPHQLTVVMAGYEPWEQTVQFVNGAREVRLQAVLAPLVGRLEVSSLPAGAEVIVNGQVRGSTPATIDQLPRNEDLIVELRLRGYRAVRRTVQWGGQRAVALTVPLEKSN